MKRCTRDRIVQTYFDFTSIWDGLYYRLHSERLGMWSTGISRGGSVVTVHIPSLANPLGAIFCSPLLLGTTLFPDAMQHNWASATICRKSSSRVRTLEVAGCLQTFQPYHFSITIDLRFLPRWFLCLFPSWNTALFRIISLLPFSLNESIPVQYGQSIVLKDPDDSLLGHPFNRCLLALLRRLNCMAQLRYRTQ